MSTVISYSPYPDNNLRFQRYCRKLRTKNFDKYDPRGRCFMIVPGENDLLCTVEDDTAMCSMWIRWTPACDLTRFQKT